MTVSIEADAALTPDGVDAAYGRVARPQRDAWRLDAIGRSCTGFVARNGGEGPTRLLDDGGLDASLCDLIVRPDRQPSTEPDRWS